MTDPEGIKVLIGCEKSGIVRDAFLGLGFDAWSCDVKADERGSNRHLRGDVRDVLTYDDWNLLIVAHPPCTRLSNSGVRWLNEPPKNPPADATPEEVARWPFMNREERLDLMWQHLEQGCALFSEIWNADVPLMAVENPVMHPHAKERIANLPDKPSCTVQPWNFATSDEDVNNEKKRTCFWTRGLPRLAATGTLDGSTARDSIHKATPGPGRAEFRSRFFPGMAAAIAKQWGDVAVTA